MGQIKCFSVKSMWIWLYHLLRHCPVTLLGIKVPDLWLVQVQESPVVGVPKGLWNNAVRLKHTGDLSLPSLRFLR